VGSVIYDTSNLRRSFQDLSHELGGFVIVFWQSLKALATPPVRTKLIFKQCEFIGVNSSFIIILTGMFTGAVLALQSGKAFRIFNAEGVTGAVVTISLLRELSPVMSGLMIAARCGSAMAAEIGTMRVTQQIDALQVMSVDPIGYLITPRIIAGFLMTPLLCVLFSLMGMLGSYVVSIGVLGINDAIYLDKIAQYTDFDDLWTGLVKAAAFGIIITIVGCRKGFLAGGGAEGVGKATTQAVVIASVSILVADYFLTALMF
jgi:phospholipid/cholesterol/gamma-HCH transport system permease protein